MEKAKENILKKYKCKEPKLFIQYDGFDLQDGGDDVMRPDDEGHGLSKNLTYELMHGANVRVLIDPRESKETVLTLLDKIMDLIRKYDDWQTVVKGELKKDVRLQKLAVELSEENYNQDDLEYLVSTVKNMIRDREDEELPF